MTNFIHSIGYGIIASLLFIVLLAIATLDKPRNFSKKHEKAINCISVLIFLATFCLTL